MADPLNELGAPLEVLCLLVRLRDVGAQVGIEYDKLSHSPWLREEDAMDHVKLRLADMVAHEIAGDVLKGGKWTRLDDSSGVQMRVRGFWLARDEMLRALTDAYRAGFSAAPRRVATVIPGTMPSWMSYDEATDVLTIHGRKYASSMFGPEGFNAPPGTLLEVIGHWHGTTAFRVVKQAGKPQAGDTGAATGEKP